LVVELPPNLAKFRIQIRDLIFAKLIGARYALGFRINTIRMFRRTQSKYLCFHNEAERLLIILRKEGLRVDKAPFALPISSADKKVINNFLTELNGSTNLIAINPNAKRKTNLWFLDRFAQVGRRLIEDRNVRIAIVGSKKDSQKSRQLKEMIGEGAVDVAGRFTLLQAIELLKHCQLLISGDTGTVHMAAAVGTPVVGVYSARDHKGKWHPYGENNIIIRKDPACNICYREACRHLTCLKMIGEDEVLMAAEQLLRNPVRRHSPLAGVNHQ